MSLSLPSPIPCVKDDLLYAHKRYSPESPCSGSERTSSCTLNCYPMSKHWMEHHGSGAKWNFHVIFLKGEKDFVRNKVCIENIPARQLTIVCAAPAANTEKNTCVWRLLHGLTCRHPKRLSQWQDLLLCGLSLGSEKVNKAVSPYTRSYRLHTGYILSLLCPQKSPYRPSFLKYTTRICISPWAKPPLQEQRLDHRSLWTLISWKGNTSWQRLALAMFQVQSSHLCWLWRMQVLISATHLLRGVTFT